MIPIILALAILALYGVIDYFSLKPTPRKATEETIPLSHFRQITAEKDMAISTLDQSLKLTQMALTELKSQQQSKSVRLGQLTEQILPLHLQFPYDFKLLRPMFQPIDYIYFGEDKIVFIEVKLGTSQMSDKQKNIARLIKEGKVEFELHRVDEQGYKIK